MVRNIDRFIQTIRAGMDRWMDNGGKLNIVVLRLCDTNSEMHMKPERDIQTHKCMHPGIINERTHRTSLNITPCGFPFLKPAITLPG